MHFQRHKFLIDAHYIWTVYNVELVNKLFQSSFSPSATCLLGNTAQFISLPTTSSVDEDTTVGTTLITVTATDADFRQTDVYIDVNETCFDVFQL